MFTLIKAFILDLRIALTASKIKRLENKLIILNNLAEETML